MSKSIIVDINEHQTRVAALDEGELVELFVERTGKERIVGNIYMGRVQNVLPGMQAAFVDIGIEKNAFLYAGDILADTQDLEFPDQQQKPEITANIQDLVKPGQEILVQIIKEPVGTKGARVTAHITLPGRMLVLMPNVAYVGVSRRIEDEEERARLRDAIEQICPENMGVIVRTAAQGRSVEDLKADLSFLEKLWKRIEQKSLTTIPPKLLHREETLVFRTIRDMFADDVEHLVINDQEACEKLKAVVDILAPGREDSVELYMRDEDIFDYYSLESKIDKLLARKVWLKSGGYLIIDQTEAFTIVDVNTGKFVGSDDLQETLLQTNLEAAKEIARQLRLRDIGGIIIIDFIDMTGQENKDALIDALNEALKSDPTKHNVVGMTGLGLVEMTRKKVRKSLSATMEAPCPCCHGRGTVFNDESIALKIRKKMLSEMQHHASNVWLITAHKSVAGFLEKSMQGNRPFLPRGYDIYLRETNDLNIDEYRVQPVLDLDWLRTCAAEAKKIS